MCIYYCKKKNLTLFFDLILSFFLYKKNNNNQQQQQLHRAFFVYKQVGCNAEDRDGEQFLRRKRKKLAPKSIIST